MIGAEVLSQELLRTCLTSPVIRIGTRSNAVSCSTELPSRRLVATPLQLCIIIAFKHLLVVLFIVLGCIWNVGILLPLYITASNKILPESCHFYPVVTCAWLPMLQYQCIQTCHKHRHVLQGIANLQQTGQACAFTIQKHFQTNCTGKHNSDKSWCSKDSSRGDGASTEKLGGS